MTGTVDRRTSPSVVLRISKRAKPPRPCEPITMQVALDDRVEPPLENGTLENHTVGREPLRAGLLDGGVHQPVPVRVGFVGDRRRID